jgi:hypothetical protein
MAPFTNAFSWSPSRARLFAGCRRAYWWRYYGHWNGWKSDAPWEARVAWRLGKMHHFATWSGTIVHDTVERALRRLLHDGEPVTEGALHRDARAALRTGWKQSRDGDWTRWPKDAVNLWEHYYGSAADRSPERAQALSERVYRCLSHFAKGPYPGLMATLRPGAVRNLEELTKVEVLGHTVWVKPDLAFDADGHHWLLDWKTGVPKEEDRFQIGVYALLARDGWALPPERVSGRLVYLHADSEETVPVTAALIDETRARIEASMEAMLAPLRDRTENLADPGDFPQTMDRAECRACNFHHLCFGAEGAPGAMLMAAAIRP